MAWVHLSAGFLALLLLAVSTQAAICPDSCICTTHNGLHSATCSNLAELYKFTLRQKHHNINILDLSHNNITKLSHELDRLTEIVTLDLSTNGITDLNKFLHNAKKLVHLNLAHNRITSISLTHLPTSVSSLDLTNNLLQDVPMNFEHLNGLEHLELEGNPLDCSCANIRARDRLLIANVFIDKVICVTPAKVKGRSWLELKTKDICKVPTVEPNYLDMMMGDQPVDAVKVGEETAALKSMSLISSSALEEGHVINGDNPTEDDEKEFMKVGIPTSPSPLNDIEGSGEVDSTSVATANEPTHERKLSADLLKSDEMLSADKLRTTIESVEGSGEGSGFDMDWHTDAPGTGGVAKGRLLDINDYTTDDTPDDSYEGSGFAPVFFHDVLKTTTPAVEEFNPGKVTKIFDDDNNNTISEFPVPKAPTLYQGGPNWHSHTDPPVTEKAATPQIIPDTTISQKVTKELESKAADGDKQTTHKTGTYVCIAIIVVLLVGLIGFAIIKGQMRKRRDRRLLRQQKRDVEKASKEMVDMNKSLLGKPALAESPIEKKVNGKYELVPTHETTPKKNENGDVGNGIKASDTNGLRTDSPRDTNQNKSSSKDNNLSKDDSVPIQDTSFDSVPETPDSRKDNNSLSSEDIFVPINDDDIPRLNGNADSDVSHPLINGDQNTDSDFLSPSREYVPVYSPDMGRVRIKMTETPKPKTPVLVTRSRSNAGDIIITPSLDGNLRKSTT